MKGLVGIYGEMSSIRFMEVIFAESSFAQNIQLTLHQRPKVIVGSSFSYKILDYYAILLANTMSTIFSLS